MCQNWFTNEPLLAHRFTMPKVAQDSCLPKTVESCFVPFLAERVCVFLYVTECINVPKLVHK